jgi:general secretion pathway protein A
VEGYNEFFGLSESPFGETPDSRFLYLTPCHREILESVVCAIRDRRGFVVITGEVGTGKTSFVYRLLSTLALDKKIKPVLLFHTTLTLNDLLKGILLKIDPKVGELNKRTLVKKLDDHLLQMLDQGRILSLLKGRNLLPAFKTER